MCSRRRAEAGPPVSTGPFPGRALRALSLLALGLAILGAFGGTLRNGWILYDDPSYVIDNPRVDVGWNWPGAVAFLHVPHGANWHPLTSWSHMLDVQFFGLNPGPHHAVSLALHLLNGVLLALALRSLTGAWWRSLLAAAAFALHPLRVESVAWVAERKDVLSGLFFVLALAAYGRWVRWPGPANHARLAAIFALGLMAKPMLVTLPFVLLLLDRWPLGRWRRPGAPPAAGLAAKPFPALVREKWLLLALALASAIVTWIFQRGSGAMADTHPITLLRRLCNAPASYAWYLAKTVWPAGLAPFYPLDASRPLGATIAWAALAGAALALATGLLWRQRARPWLAVGWSWFLGMLVPVIGIVQVGIQARADRYTYLPSIGLAIALAWGAGEVVERRPALRAAAAALAVAVLAALGTATARQVALWKDTRTLFTHDIAVAGDNPTAEKCLADAAHVSGGPARPPDAPRGRGR